MRGMYAGIPGQPAGHFFGIACQAFGIRAKVIRALRHTVGSSFDHVEMRILWHLAVTGGLQFEHFCITATHPREFFVCSFFGDAAVLKYYDAVSHTHS